MAESRESLPRSVRVVIVGGGVIGCSIAYHLAELGWNNVLLLERAQLTSGTTWHAAGLLTTLRDTEAQTQLAAYTQTLYGRLEQETGQATGLIQCGSIQLALTPDKEIEMRRGFRAAQSFGIECEEISAAEVRRHWPLAYVDDIKAAFYFPKDGRVNPADVTQALARGARKAGVRIVENTPVTAFERKDGRVTAVITEKGRVETALVVNCAGMWARQVGRLAGVDVPLQAAEHYYLISDAVEGVHQKLPILRDPGRSAYIREEAGKIMVGIFETVARPWRTEGIPQDFTFGDIPPDWDRLQPELERAIERVPILAQTGIKLLFCGPESFTPDHNYLMGEAPNLKGFYTAAGFNSLGILSGGGAGRVMAHWIVNGHAPMDVWSVNIRRMHPWQNNTRYLADRVVESLGIGYQDHWPYRQWTTARGVKQGILHDRLEKAGACFGESAGWERPNWYARPGQKPEYQYSWGRQNWFDNHAEEHRAVRERVGVFEQSSFAKILVQGRDAEAALDRISTASCRVPVGRIIYTQFLNPRGGIEADITVSRMREDCFMVVTAAFTASHVKGWLTDHIGATANCVVTDVSDAWSMLNVQGPRSRDLLASIATTDWSSEGFAFGTAREVQIGYQSAFALRVSYTGELGWEVYVPVPFTLGVYDALIEAGKRFDLQHCGYHALESLRMEKAFRSWAHDVGPDDDPFQAGLASTCAWDKPDGFIGRDALLQRRGQTPTRRLVQLLLDDPGHLLYHNEPILRDGERVGFITSGMFGHTLGASVGLGYVTHAAGVTAEYIRSGRFEVLIGDVKVPARCSLRPLYDPEGARLRS